MLELALAAVEIRNLGEGGRRNAVPNPLDSRFRGNDGGEIGGDSVIIAHFSLMSTHPSGMGEFSFAFSPRHSRFLPPSFPLSPPVIPAKAGIQTVVAKPAASRA